MADESPITIEVTGIDELLARYQLSEQISTQLLVDAMGNALDYVAQDAATYPAETAANQPPPPYYIRGTGTQLAHRNLGESQQLGEHWAEEVSLENDGVIGTVSNAVTYAPYVQGRTMQAGPLATIGWRTVSKIKDDVSDKVTEYFQVASKLLVAFLNGGL
jgi:hypothetical protein